MATGHRPPATGHRPPAGRVWVIWVMRFQVTQVTHGMRTSAATGPVWVIWVISLTMTQMTHDFWRGRTGSGFMGHLGHLGHHFSVAGRRRPYKPYVT